MLALAILVGASFACTGGSSYYHLADPDPSVTLVAPLPRAVDVPINTAIVVTFVNPVDSTSIDSTTFLVGGVTGTISYDSSDRSAIFRPTASLPINTTFTVSLTSGIRLADGLGTAITPYSFTFTTGASTDTTGPRGTLSSPTPQAVNVPVNGALTKTFSEPLDPATVTDSVFAIGGATGTVRLVGSTIILTPTSPLSVNTSYACSVTATIRGLAGDTIAAGDSFFFTTGPIADNTRPTVETTVPAHGENGAAPAITIVFSEEMNPATVTTAAIRVSGVTGVVQCAGRVATFYPTQSLTAGAIYSVTVASSVKDLAGNKLLADYSFVVQAASSSDVTAPSVASTVPASGDTDVRINRGIHILFSEPMDPATINGSTIRIANETGLVRYDPATRIASFTPVGTLRTGTLESVTISRGAKDLTGNSLAADVIFTFTTGSSSDSAPPALGSAGGFAVLGGSSVASTGTASSVHGDLGVSPGVALTGFYGTSANEGPSTVNGTVFQGVAVASGAQTAVAAAVTDISSRTPDTVLTGTALDGLTLTPGVFIDTGNTTFSGGVLTLDARGRADGLFIFRISGNLTAAAGSRVVLANGAAPGRVFWQVGGSATLGSGTVFQGNLLAQNAITLNAATVGRGRAVSAAGTVTLADSATIRRPQ